MRKFCTILILFKCFNFLFSEDLNSNIDFNNDNNFYFLKNFQIIDDKKNNNITFKFNNKNKKRIYIWRSYKKKSDYKIIGYSDNSIFNDIAAEPGIQYWYKIGFVKDEENLNCNDSDSTVYVKEFHRKINIVSKNFNKLLEEKKEKNPIINDNEKKELDLIKKYYTHPVKLFFIFNMIKFYIKKNELVVLSDYNNYNINYKNKILTIYDYDENFILKLHSKKIFRCLKKIKKNKKIFNRLIENSIAFVIQSDEKLVNFDNYNKYIPTFEAIGIATLYFKNDSNWKNNTIIFGTSNKQLKRKLDEIQKKYNKTYHHNHNY